MYGIFDKNKNYKLLRFSNIEQTENVYMVSDGPGFIPYEVHEVCIPEIDYVVDNIGKEYDPINQTWT